MLTQEGWLSHTPLNICWAPETLPIGYSERVPEKMSFGPRSLEVFENPESSAEEGCLEPLDTVCGKENRKQWALTFHLTAGEVCVSLSCLVVLAEKHA